MQISYYFLTQRQPPLFFNPEVITIFQICSRTSLSLQTELSTFPSSVSFSFSVKLPFTFNRRNSAKEKYEIFTLKTNLKFRVVFPLMLSSDFRVTKLNIQFLWENRVPIWHSLSVNNIATIRYEEEGPQTKMGERRKSDRHHRNIDATQQPFNPTLVVWNTNLSAVNSMRWCFPTQIHANKFRFHTADSTGVLKFWGGWGGGGGGG
jgi:hypothetical protein